MGEVDVSVAAGYRLHRPSGDVRDGASGFRRSQPQPYVAAFRCLQTSFLATASGSGYGSACVGAPVILATAPDGALQLSGGGPVGGGGGGPAPLASSAASGRASVGHGGAALEVVLRSSGGGGCDGDGHDPGLRTFGHLSDQRLASAGVDLAGPSCRATVH